MAFEFKMLISIWIFHQNFLIFGLWTLFKQDIDVKDALSIFRSIIRLSGWIVGFYFICHFGGEVTSRFQDIVYSIYDCPWYSMPLKIRKYFPLMIAATQQPIYLNGCFNIRCIQETFQKVPSNNFYFKCNFFKFRINSRLCCQPIPKLHRTDSLQIPSSSCNNFHAFSSSIFADGVRGIFVFHGFEGDYLNVGHRFICRFFVVLY